MKIEYTNRNLIDNELNIHDAIFKGFIYDDMEKILLLELENYYLNKKYKLQFYNVLILNCEMCQFWGKSPNILDWEVCDKNSLIQNMIKKQNENKESYKCSLVDIKKSYLETIITLSSGDTITIVCEYIQFQEDDANV